MLLPFLHPNFAVPLAAHGLREEPEFVTARAGEAVVLRCDVIHPVTGQPPPYVVEWFKFGVPIPIFIKFGYYPPHVDPEYAGKGPFAFSPWFWQGCPSPPGSQLSVVMLPAAFISIASSFFSDLSVISVFHSLCLFLPILWTLVGSN